jgi:hypothetical protein
MIGSIAEQVRNYDELINNCGNDVLLEELISQRDRLIDRADSEERFFDVIFYGRELMKMDC